MCYMGDGVEQLRADLEANLPITAIVPDPVVGGTFCE
jgi:hypothetical protein